MQISNRNRKGFKRVALSEDGKVVGDSHPKSKLTDAEVDLLRDLHEEHSIGYTKLAWIFRGRGISVETVRSICLYRRRNVHTAKSKYVKE